MSSKMFVRDGTIDDCAIVLRLMQEHAKEFNIECLATEESLAQNVFNSSNIHVVMIENYIHAIVGYALYFVGYSALKGKNILYLDDLFILPNYRRQGFGKTLMRTLVKITLDKDATSLMWSVPAENKNALEFYKHWGAQVVNGIVPFYVDGSTLDGIADF